jgi:hypothetical protein
MQGTKNSQFGTCWIHDNFQNLKIKKEDLQLWIDEGWLPGRQMKFAYPAVTKLKNETVNISQPVRVNKLRGTVEKGLYGKGSKSEREAVFIQTSDMRYVLRRKTGPAFGDSELDIYIGHVIECDGFAIGTTLLAENMKIV